MSNQDYLIHEKLGHLIRWLQQIASALFMAKTVGFDMTPVQYCALLAVQLHPDIDQTALGNIIACDRSTIGNVVTRLERKKLIKRVAGPVDQRTKIMFVTSPGRELLRRIEPGCRWCKMRFWRRFVRMSAGLSFA
jgi:DNA-binding MarR family transcriptional regulator